VDGGSPASGIRPTVQTVPLFDVLRGSGFTLRDSRSGLRRLTRRHRRPLAAAAAAGAAALALASLRTPPVVEAQPGPPRIGEGQVTVPVTLASSAVASLLQTGDLVDLVAISEQGEASIVAEGAHVVAAASAGALSAASAVILVAVDEHDALPVSVAGATGPLAPVIRRR
jgi:hypothetical protein